MNVREEGGGAVIWISQINISPLFWNHIIKNIVDQFHALTF